MLTTGQISNMNRLALQPAMAMPMYMPRPAQQAYAGPTPRELQIARAAEERARRAAAAAAANEHRYAMELQGQGLAADYNRAAMEANTRANMADAQQFADMQMLREQGAINQVLARDEAAARTRLQELAGRQDIAAIQERGQIEEQLAQMQGEQQMQLQQLQGQQQVGLQESENLNRMRLQMMDDRTRMNMGDQQAYYAQQLADQNNAAAMKQLMETGRQNVGLAELQGQQRMDQLGVQEKGLRDRLDTELTGRMDQIGATNRAAMDQAQLREWGAWDRAELAGKQSSILADKNNAAAMKRARTEGRNRLNVAGRQAASDLAVMRQQGENYTQSYAQRGEDERRAKTQEIAFEKNMLGWKLNPQQELLREQLEAERSNLWKRQYEFPKGKAGERDEWVRRMRSIDDRLDNLMASASIRPTNSEATKGSVEWDEKLGGYVIRQPDGKISIQTPGASTGRGRTGAGGIADERAAIHEQAMKMTESVIANRTDDLTGVTQKDYWEIYDQFAQDLERQRGLDPAITPSAQVKQEQQQAAQREELYGLSPTQQSLPGLAEEPWSTSVRVGAAPPRQILRDPQGSSAIGWGEEAYRIGAPRNREERDAMLRKRRNAAFRQVNADLAAKRITEQQADEYKNRLINDVQRDEQRNRAVSRVLAGETDYFAPEIAPQLLEKRFSDDDDRDILSDLQQTADEMGDKTVQLGGKKITVKKATDEFMNFLAKYGTKGPPSGTTDYEVFKHVAFELNKAGVLPDVFLGSFAGQGVPWSETLARPASGWNEGGIRMGN